MGYTTLKRVMPFRLLTVIICLGLVFFTSCYVARNGFYKNGGGTRYYINDVYQTGWKTIDGEKYYFSLVDGYMMRKPCTIAGVSYSFAEDGTLVNGFVKEEGGTRYYVDGISQTGWHDIDGERYYFTMNDGYMITGEKIISGITYIFGEDGKLVGQQ